MRFFRRPALAVLSALVLAGALAGVSSANRLAFSSNTWRAAWSMAGEPPPGFISCPFTLEGSFHSRTLSKVAEALIGYVTRATVAEVSCRGGKMRFLPERLPWHVRYASFTGTLPNITSITARIIGLSVLGEWNEIPGTQCLYVSTATRPARFILGRSTTTGVITEFRMDETAVIPKTSGGALCHPEIFLSGLTAPTVLGSTATITVTLVA
jgi:hypothetical protein